MTAHTHIHTPFYVLSACNLQISCPWRGVAVLLTVVQWGVTQRPHPANQSWSHQSAKAASHGHTNCHHTRPQICSSLTNNPCICRCFAAYLRVCSVRSAPPPYPGLRTCCAQIDNTFLELKVLLMSVILAGSLPCVPLCFPAVFPLSSQNWKHVSFRTKISTQVRASGIAILMEICPDPSRRPVSFAATPPGHFQPDLVLNTANSTFDIHTTLTPPRNNKHPICFGHKEKLARPHLDRLRWNMANRGEPATPLCSQSHSQLFPTERSSAVPRAQPLLVFVCTT